MFHFSSFSAAWNKSGVREMLRFLKEVWKQWSLPGEKEINGICSVTLETQPPPSEFSQHAVFSPTTSKTNLKAFPREICLSLLQCLWGVWVLVESDTGRNCAVNNRKLVKNERCPWGGECRADGSNCESHCDNWQEKFCTLDTLKIPKIPESTFHSFLKTSISRE